MRSLRARLSFAGTVGVLIAALLGAWGIGAAFERAVEGDARRRLETELDALIGLAETDASGAWRLRSEPANPAYRRIFSGTYWLIVAPDRTERSRSLWDFDPGNVALRDADVLTGPRGQPLRVAARDVRLPRAPAPLHFVVAEDRTATRAEVRDFARGVLFAQLALGLVLLGLVAWQVRWGLRPLRDLGDRLAAVRAGERTRLGLARLPTELAPLASEVDALLESHELQVERTRRGSADLAHALKTPLAVLAAATNAAQDRALADTVRTEVDRMQAAIDRRLGGAVVDRRARTPLEPVARELAALLERAHAGRGVSIELALDPELRVRCAREDLEEIVGNVLDNACKFARSRVRLSGASSSRAAEASRRAKPVHGHEATPARRIELVIEDDGPGIATSDVPLALQRGIRLDERVPGTGLGLSIVATLVEAYGGELAVERSDALGGALVRVRLPAD